MRDRFEKKKGQTSFENTSRQIECWVLQMERRKVFEKQCLHNLISVDEQRERRGQCRVKKSPEWLSSSRWTVIAEILKKMLGRD